GQRFRVDYVYDNDRHTDIAMVTDSYGLVATTTFDGPTGRITSRTDPNGQTTSYTYDAFGRISTITGPYEQGTGNATVTFAYFPTASAYSYATAVHYDAFNPGDTIDTVTFLDGIGRETQTKQDGTVFTGAQGTPEDVMIVGGAVEYDALGRPVKEWFPTTEALGTIGTYNTSAEPANNPLQTIWNLRDQPIEVIAPNGNTVTTAYGFASDSQILGGATLFTTTVTDPLGKPVTSWTDVRDNVLAVDDDPPTADLVRTRYSYDPLGELTMVIDPAGSITSHSYDMLGRRLTTNTPNAGLLEQTWDPAGNIIAVVDPVLRPLGQHVDYDYEFTRLVAINYPDATPDVSYTYGGPGAVNNGAGRVIALSDGARPNVYLRSTGCYCFRDFNHEGA
ncbi:MAG: sugar-binding protein, partial [Anaerolineae bacterium]